MASVSFWHSSVASRYALGLWISQASSRGLPPRRAADLVGRHVQWWMEVRVGGSKEGGVPEESVAVVRQALEEVIVCADDYFFWNIYLLKYPYSDSIGWVRLLIIETVYSFT